MEGSVILRRRRRNFAKSPWTQERVEYVAARWSQGASALQISRELGQGISKSAVLGTIHRFDIVDLSPFAGRRGRRSDKKAAGANGARALKQSPAYCPARTNPAWVGNAKPFVDDPRIDADIPHAQRRSLLELTDDTCRWPVGDPCAADFFFCGAPPLPGKPYCAAHCARAERVDEAEAALVPDDVLDLNSTEREEA
jgi:GcrA cell cycle regulator